MQIFQHEVVLFVAAVFATSCGGCDTIEGQPWEFGELQEDDAVPNNGVANNGQPNNGAADTDEDDSVNNVVPIERICDDALPPQTVLSEPGLDVVRYSLAVGADGCPMASWYAAQRIRFAKWNGSSWDTEDVFLGAAWRNELIADSDGVPTLFGKKANTPGFVRWRREEGEWVEKESTGTRWNWGLHAVSARTVVARTATQEHTGSDLALHIVRRSGDDWTWSRVVDFELRGLGPPPLTYDDKGAAVLPLLENKGYGPMNRETNLWLATSDDAALSSWTPQRVPIGALNDFSMAYLYAVEGRLRLLARAEVALEGGSRQILHARRDDSGEWTLDLFDECPFSTWCSLGAFEADVLGRLHIVRGQNDGLAEGYSVELGILEGDQWRFVPVGIHEETPSGIAIDDETGAVHLVTIQREDQRTRNLVYVPVTDI